MSKIRIAPPPLNIEYKPHSEFGSTTPTYRKKVLDWKAARTVERTGLPEDIVLKVLAADAERVTIKESDDFEDAYAVFAEDWHTTRNMHKVRFHQLYEPMEDATA